MRRFPFLILSIPLAVVLASTGAEARPGGGSRVLDDLMVSSETLDRPWAPASRVSVGELALAEEGADPDLHMFDEEGAAPRRWWPLVASAVLPGLGESLTGHRRGWFMIAADAGLWYGVKDKNDLGNEKEEEFEAFADEHWKEDRWINALADGDLQEYFPDLVAGSTVDDVALYVSREEDEREWYENLGKWDVFSWGWREYWEDGYDPGDPDDPQFITPLRQQYLDLRGESNDAFGIRDRYLTVAMLLRVFSVMQVAYLEGFIGGRYSEAASEADGPQAGWFLEPQGLTGTQIGWKVSY